jgi:tRNA A-37 threonylcarbamoyl transferase component Bud32
MRAPASTIELIDLVRKSGIHPGGQLDKSLSVFPNLPVDPTASAALLVKQGMLTKFQAKLLLTGRWRGFKLGSYIVREQLGQGGMGAVYLAEHETLKRQVALKVLPPSKNDQNAKLNIERFLREARAAAALDHPNIVRIHDVGHQGEVHFLVMEYVEGQTLEDMLRKGGPVTPSRAVEYIAQAAAGLQHAHEKNFIHRDIKPANLMLAKDGTVKILDMGLARSSSSESDKLTERMDEGAIVGTADFISPEQAINAPNIDIRSDIYSLGATFFALVTGTPPFSGNTTQKLVQHQMKDAPSLTTIDRTFPPGLAKVVARMLHKKPEKRYQTPGEVITAVAEWLPNAGAQRMVVSLSGTDLAHSVEMQATLSELATGGTARIGASKRLGLVPGKKPWKLYAGVGGALALAAILVAWAVSGNSSDRNDPAAGLAVPPVNPANPNPSPNPGPAPKSNPNPAKPPAPKTTPAVATVLPPAAGGPIVYKLDPAEFETFRAVFQHNQLREGRLGKLPNGWNCQVYRMEATGEFRVEAFAGQKVFLIGASEGTAASQLVFRPERVNVKPFQPGKSYEVRFESKADTGIKGYSSVQIVGDWKTIATTEFGSGTWKWYSHKFTMPESGDVQLTFGSRTLGVDKFVHFRKIEIAESEPPAPNVAGANRYLFDGAKIQPFSEGGKLVMGANNQKDWKVERKTGAWPANWYGRPWRENDEAEFFAETVDGRMVLGSRNTAGKGSAMLITPEVDGFDGKAILTLEYRTDSTQPVKHGLRFLPTKPTKDKAFDLAKLDPTNGTWKTATLELDLKGASGGRLEFHNNDTGPGGEFRLRALAWSTLTGPPAKTAVETVEGPALKTVAFGTLTPFRSTFADKKFDGNAPAQYPPGVYVDCWDAASVAEFRANEVEGRVGLGVTNLNDTLSSQILLQELGELRAGERYRAKIEYLTKNDANGKAQLRRPKEGYVAFANANLPGTNGQWRTATVDFVRPPADVEIDLQIGNASIGEGNTLYVHTIEIVPLRDAGPPPRSSRGTGTAEPPAGPRVFAVDFVGKVPFHYTIRDKKPSLETWRVLPAGVKGHCWKTESEVEFKGEDVKGKPALGVANLNDAVSSQVQVDFGEGPASKIVGGKSYRIVVEYLAPEGVATTASVRKPKEKFLRIAQKELPATAGEWMTATIEFTAPVGAPLDFILENATVGKDKTLHIAKVEVFEVN